jgi:hypothetical protein
MCLSLLPLLTLASPASPGIVVREAQGRIDVAAAAAPLADVLDRLARQTGMKIVYEGPAPRQLVTLSLVGRSPAEAVTAILEGQGLNYALILDVTATRVEKLLVTGAASSSASGPRSVSTTAPRYAPPPPEPEPDEPPEEPAVTEPTAPPIPEKPQPPQQQPQQQQPQPTSLAAPNGPPLPPGMTAAPPGLPVFPINPPAAPGAPAPQPTPTPTPPP